MSRSEVLLNELRSWGKKPQKPQHEPERPKKEQGKFFVFQVFVHEKKFIAMSLKPEEFKACIPFENPYGQVAKEVSIRIGGDDDRLENFYSIQCGDSTLPTVVMLGDTAVMEHIPDYAILVGRTSSGSLTDVPYDITAGDLQKAVIRWEE